ncbi:hypothetical protein N752_23250 [Desulforamulus aquiferis]|nr:hypothetical protein N752_23250 [Desulforamulus aquiferis]
MGDELVLAIIECVALQGLEGQKIWVEVDVSNGLPSMDIVGLPDAAVREAKDRYVVLLRTLAWIFRFVGLP